MVALLLKDGTLVLVDKEDIELLSKYSWRFNAARGYVETFIHEQRYTVGIHRVIMGLHKGDRIQVDHIDHNPLNNHRSNLRIVTYSQNQLNRKGPQPNNLSGILGVTYKKDHEPKPWQGRKSIMGKVYRTNYYATPEEAKTALQLMEI